MHTYNFTNDSQYAFNAVFVVNRSRVQLRTQDVEVIQTYTGWAKLNGANAVSFVVVKLRFT